jgi:hypothetical protein
MGSSWFQRSSSGKTRPEAAVPEPPAKPAAATGPLRVRNLLLLNLQPAEDAAAIETAPPLGSRAGVVSTIRAAATDIEFSGSRGEIVAADYGFSIDLGPEDPVLAAVVQAEGARGIEILRALLGHARWRAYAPRSGVFVEPQTLEKFAGERS